PWSSTLEKLRDPLQRWRTLLIRLKRAIRPLCVHISLLPSAPPSIKSGEDPGQTDLKFEGRPSLLNTGNTPARNVRIRTAAEILPIPIPKDFQFALPDENEIKDAGVVGAHQTYIIGASVKDFVPDS